MTNPIIHTLVFIAAVLVPGGLLVYFAWRATRRILAVKANSETSRDSDGSEYISEDLPEPDDAREAFCRMYPSTSDLPATD